MELTMKDNYSSASEAASEGYSELIYHNKNKNLNQSPPKKLKWYDWLLLLVFRR
jgi:hypothetical protein